MSTINNNNVAIDFKNVAAHFPSLCIPRVFANIKEDRIRKIFADLDIGEISRIDIVSKNPAAANDKENFNRIFIHFKYWKQSDQATAARERILNGKEIKIIYDEPWFWKVSAYRPPVPHDKPKIQKSFQSQSSRVKKATIDLGDDNIEGVKYSGIIAPGFKMPEIPHPHPIKEKEQKKTNEPSPLPVPVPVPVPEIKKDSHSELEEDEHEHEHEHEPSKYENFVIDYGNLSLLPKKPRKKRVIVQEKVKTNIVVVD